MDKFKGFTDSETFSQLPDSFFHQLLKEIKDADELKVTLYFLWRAGQMEGPFRALTRLDFDVRALGLSAEEITRGLEKAVKRGSLLKVRKEAQVYFLLNSPRGRAGVQAIESGKWDPAQSPSAPPAERPNVFRLYEENIGPLTPLIADTLKDAEALYPAEWIADAIELAVKNNKRNWKYCEAILKRWKDEGTHGQKTQQSTGKGSERYTNSEFEEYLKRD
ncbi:MAG: DnaD domain protein [Chloroflexota bacterium]|jgi:DnaD/phage-associated family protein